MDIDVNGKEQKLNIGCRTFISFAELLKLLKINQEQQLVVNINGEIIPRKNFANLAVSNTDTVRLLGKTL